MASDKSIIGLGLLAKVESSYSGSTTLSTAADGIQVAELPEFSIEYNYDGARSYAQGVAGTTRRVGGSGRFTNGTVKIEGKGLGATYTSTATPPNLHPFLLASGMSGSLLAGSWVYKPQDSGTPSSLALEVYTRGEKRVIRGTYGSWKVGTDSPAPPVFEFGLQGLVGLPATSTLPSISYSGSAVVPPKAEGVVLSIGGTTGFKLRSFSFDMGREITPRLDLDADGGHAGFAPGRRAPKLTLTVEATALSTFDPYTAFANATQYAVSLTIGSVANNRYVLALPQAQLADVKDSVDGNVATWDLVFEAPTSGPASSDDFTLSFT